MSHLEESVAEMDCRTITVQDNFSDELSEVTKEEAISSLREEKVMENYILHNIPSSLDLMNETHELSEVTREEVLSSLREEKVEKYILESMPQTLSLVAENQSKLLECQSRHYI